MSKKIQIWKI